MNQNIITYLNENKEKYPREVLVAELKKAGYAEGDIAEGIAQVFGLPSSAKTSFWNFKDKKVYTKASEKWADFLFGLCVPLVVGITLSFIGRGLLPLYFGQFRQVVWLVTGLLFYALVAMVLVRSFHRRRFIFYGMIIYTFPVLFVFLRSVLYFVL